MSVSYTHLLDVPQEFEEKRKRKKKKMFDERCEDEISAKPEGRQVGRWFCELWRVVEQSSRASMFDWSFVITKVS